MDIAVNPHDVIRRVVKAWLAAYDMTHAEFAEAVGMNGRTLARRLSGTGPGRRFDAAELADMAGFMSAVLGEPVSVDDLYAGRVNVGPAGLEPATYGLVVPNFPTAA